MLHSRKKRLEHVIRESLASIISEMKDPRVNLLTVTEVRLSSDLRLATVYVSMLDKRKAGNALKALSSAHGFIKKQLGERVVIKYLPDVLFKYDESLDRAARIETLLAGIREEEAAHAPEDPVADEETQ